MRILPVGPSALLVELENQDSVLALAAEAARRRDSDWLGRVVDVVPGASTVLLDGVADPAALARELSGWEPARLPLPDSPIVEIRCRYDGADLGSVAACWGVEEDEVPTMHASAEHRVAFCGFSPGFAYIVSTGGRPPVPRLAAPRPAVDAGSVALAGTFTGIYPRQTPGGWRIIGHTDAVLWDADRDPPALLSPGTRVRFLTV